MDEFLIKSENPALIYVIDGSDESFLDSSNLVSDYDRS